MSRRQKLVFVGFVLLLGGALAWQFRKGKDQATDPAKSSADSRGWLAAASPKNADSAMGQDSGRRGIADPQPPSPSSVVEDRPKTPIAPADPTVPTLPTAFTGGTLGQPSATAAPVSDPFGGVSLVSNRLPGEQSHKLIDGDTLPSLAEHYLGSAARWPELYQYNRDVLASPDLLPIGGELRIPPQAAGAPRTPAMLVGGRGITDNVAAAPDRPTGAPARPVSQNVVRENPAPQSATTDLVPVTPAAPSAGGEMYRLPQPSDAAGPAPVPTDPFAAHAARSSSPVARIVRVSPSVYQVKPGDTLASIAQQIYGNVARQDLLLQANHDRVKSAEDIRPGMTLIVPLAE